MISLAALATLGGTQALAQGGWYECIDPANMQPYSTDFLTIGEGNILMAAATGLSGTVQYGDTDDMGPPSCYADPVTFQVAGGFGFMAGPIGSVQDQNPADPNSSFVDDDQVFTFGMPIEPMREGGIAMTIEDTTRTILARRASTNFGMA